MRNYEISTYRSGQNIILEGKVDRRFCILANGLVDVSREIDTGVDTDDTITKGCLFGVVSALCDEPQLNSVSARTDSQVISVGMNNFVPFIKERPQVAFAILQGFSAKQRKLNDGLAALLGTGANPGGQTNQDALLFATGDYYESHGNPGAALYCYQKYLEYYPQSGKTGEAKNRSDTLAQSVAVPQARSGMVQQFKKDEMIFAEGEPGDTLYVIQKGSVKIGKVAGNKELIFAVDKVGDMFGEMALLDNAPRSAGAMANEDCTLTAVNKQGFAAITAAQPELVNKISRTLAERLWFMDKQFANAHIRDPEGRMLDGIVMHYQKDHVKMPTRHTFSFGIDELAKMVGVADQTDAIAKIRDNKSLGEENGKLTVMDIEEIMTERNTILSVQRREDNIKKSKEKS
jgi:CRP-like cAMP-binding protein